MSNWYWFFFSTVEVRKSLHSRLGLPLDRPLLRIANALNFLTTDGGRSTQKGNSMLLYSPHCTRHWSFPFLILLSLTFSPIKYQALLFWRMYTLEYRVVVVSDKYHFVHYSFPLYPHDWHSQQFVISIHSFWRHSVYCSGFLWILPLHAQFI